MSQYLSKVFPSHFRFGRGDITDTRNNKSGQVDIVVEFPFAPSLPSVGDASSRLYPAESVAAVIEVKSDIRSAWDDVCSKAADLARIYRLPYDGLTFGTPLMRIPFFVVGFTGWQNEATIYERMKDHPIDGVLQIDNGVFRGQIQELGILAMGPSSLWGLIMLIHIALTSVSSTRVDLSPYIIPQSPSE